MAETLHVALLIETSREFARGLLRGVAHFQKEHGPWSIYMETHGSGDPPPSWLETWRGDGILVRIEDQETADLVLKTGIPAVDVSGAISDLGLKFVGVDNRPLAKLVFEHLFDCGLRQFAYCGTLRGENSHRDLRCDFFMELVREAGYECDSLLRDWAGGRSTRWEQEQMQVAQWLRKLPKPIGLMTCDDEIGHQVLDACRRAEILVPDQVAVIGVNNDPTICNLSTPPLTSIDVNPIQIGYEAARLLAERMNGIGQDCGTASRCCCTPVNEPTRNRRRRSRFSGQFYPRTCSARDSSGGLARSMSLFAKHPGTSFQKDTWSDNQRGDYASQAVTGQIAAC